MSFELERSETEWTDVSANYPFGADGEFTSFVRENFMRRALWARNEFLFTGARCFWIAFVCGIVNVFFMAYFVHVARSGPWIGLIEMIDPTAIGGIVVGGLMSAFLILLDGNLLCMLVLQAAFVLLTFTGVLLLNVDGSALMDIAHMMADRSIGVMAGLLGIIDSIPSGRIQFIYVCCHGALLYLCIMAVTSPMRHKACVYGRYAAASICVLCLMISFFFLSLARNANLKTGSISISNIVEETLVQNRYFDFGPVSEDENANDRSGTIGSDEM